MSNKLIKQNQNLKKTYNTLQKKVIRLTNNVQDLEYILEKQVKPAKTFKLWQFYNQIKRNILILNFVNIEKGLKTLVEKGPKFLIEKIKLHKKDIQQKILKTNQYKIWLLKHKLTKQELKNQKTESFKFKFQPKISLIVPVYNTDPQWLSKSIESVIHQTYGNWELCLVDDGSTNKKTKLTLSQWSKKDKRIKIRYLQKNLGIALASQAAVEITSGSYIGLLDHDDELTPDALFEVVKVLNINESIDFIYSDEDKITQRGELTDPFFKPDWSPDLFLSMMYVAHFTVYKKNLIEKAGGFDSRFNGSQDYDLALRISRLTQNIYHIPKILYHWRMIPTSAAFRGDVKEYSVINAKKALEMFLYQNKIKAQVLYGFGLGRWRIKYEIEKKPKISIILLTGGRLDLLNNCLKSIFRKTHYDNYQIIVVDNSCKKSTRNYLLKMKKKYPKQLRFYQDNLKPFNFPKLCNNAVKKIDSPYVVLLNDDTEIITHDWLESMLEYCQQDNVAIVGCKLLYPNKTIQHAGVFMGAYGICGHAFKGIDNDLHYYFDFPHVVRNVSAVTFACAMIKTNVYRELGGLDDKNLKVAYNDIDFCLKTRKKSYSIIYTPYALLYHLESVTKKVHMLPGEQEYFKRKWTREINNDPYYNKNLTKKAEDYSLNI